MIQDEESSKNVQEVDEEKPTTSGSTLHVHTSSKKNEEMHKSADTKENEKPPECVGTEFVQRIRAYFCQLCSTYLLKMKEIDLDEAVTKHCQSSMHRNCYFKLKGNLERSQRQLIRENIIANKHKRMKMREHSYHGFLGEKERREVKRTITENIYEESSEFKLLGLTIVKDLESMLKSEEESLELNVVIETRAVSEDNECEKEKTLDEVEDKSPAS